MGFGRTGDGMMIRAKGRGFKSSDKIGQENQADYKRLGELMGDRLLPKLALNMILVEANWGSPRSIDLEARKDYAYVKIKEFLAKGFIKEPYPLHYAYDIYWTQQEATP